MVLLLLCIAFVAVSKIGQSAYDIGQVYRVVERPEVGQTWCELPLPKVCACERSSLSLPQRSALTRIFLPYIGRRFLEHSFQRRASCHRDVDNGMFTVLADFEGDSGEYRFEIGMGFVALFPSITTTSLAGQRRDAVVHAQRSAYALRS
jgi:hypothetical protein